MRQNDFKRYLPITEFKEGQNSRQSHGPKAKNA